MGDLARAAPIADVLVVGAVAREVDIAHDGTTSVRLAGSGLVAALVAARFGARVTLAGFVGSEDIDALACLASAYAVDIAAVAVVEGSSPQYVFGDPTGTSAVPHPAFRPSENLPRFRPPVPDAPSVALLFGIPGFDPIANGWLDGVDLRNSTVLWDRQGWLSAARDARHAVEIPCARRVRITKNDERGAEPDLDAGLLGPGFEAAVVKRGRWGVDLVTTAGLTPIPAFDVPVQRAIGSGDAYAGALAADIASGGSLAEAATRASAAAACFIASGDPVPPVDLAERSLRLLATGVHRWISHQYLETISGEIYANGSDFRARLITEQIAARLAALGIVTSRHDADGDDVSVRLVHRRTALATWKTARRPEGSESWIAALERAVVDAIVASAPRSPITD